MNRQLADNEDRRKNLHDFKKKICGTKKNFTDFSGVFMEKTAANPTFLRFFEEFLMPIKAIIKDVSFSANPSVSRKNLKKVPKKVLT